MLDGLLDIFSPRTRDERQIAALRKLTDRELADLGILRDQIEDFVLRRSATPG